LYYYGINVYVVFPIIIVKGEGGGVEGSFLSNRSNYFFSLSGKKMFLPVYFFFPSTLPPLPFFYLLYFK
jgi:hypothetical protein